jgi:hypothetical protein
MVKMQLDQDWHYLLVKCDKKTEFFVGVDAWWNQVAIQTLCAHYYCGQPLLHFNITSGRTSRSKLVAMCVERNCFFLVIIIVNVSPYLSGRVAEGRFALPILLRRSFWK